jgi:hypothetical protein
MAHNEDANAEDLAESLLLNYAYLYEDPDNIDKTTTFRSPLVLQLIATSHLQVTIGHADVPALNTSALSESGIIGVIALCATAVRDFFNSSKTKLIFCAVGTRSHPHPRR